MLTRKEVVIEKPFQDRRYSDHRIKVRRALPRIDTGPPREYSHLEIKLKKLRIEKDRQTKICEDNLRLVHRLAIIMRTKRMDDINTASRGPFEKKKFKFPSPAKKPYEEGVTSESDNEATFLERVTKEAIRRAPHFKTKVIQHRAPHGFCRVPELGLTFATPTGFSSQIKEQRQVYSITTGFLKRHTKPEETISEGGSNSVIEYRNKSIQISMSDLNQTSDTNNFTSTSTRSGKSTFVGTDDFEEYSSMSSGRGQESDHEIAKRLMEQRETPSSEVEDDTVISCSGFTEIEKNGPKKTIEEEENSVDSDEQVNSVLLDSTSNMTLDEPSDDDFFD